MTKTPTRTAAATLAALGLLAGIVLANYATATTGFVPVGFGLTATAGTLIAGAFLVLRDVVHDLAGVRVVLLVILAGAILSAALAGPALAIASAAAFLLAETADLLVYAPLRARSRLGGRRWALAVTVSNVVGAVVDSILFLTIAFGTVHGIGGQLVGKAWATLLYLVIGFVLAAALRSRHRAPVSA